MLTNNLFGIGNYGSLNVGPNPRGATLFVNSTIGADNRGRVSFPGASANSSGTGSPQGPQGNPALPLATIGYALSLCADNRGDTIIVQEGHLETLAANITCSVAGVQIIGQGAPNSRPQLTMAGFSIVISGVGSSISNISIVGGTTANTVGVVQLTGAGSFIQGGRLSMQEVTSIGILLGANRTGVIGVEVDGTTTGFASGILFGVFDACYIDSCNIHGIFATAPITCVANTNMVVSNNTIRQLHATVKPVMAGIVTATSGTVSNNTLVSKAAAAVADFWGGANVATNVLVGFIQNYGTAMEAGPKSAILTPAAGTI